MVCLVSRLVCIEIKNRLTYARYWRLCCFAGRPLSKPWRWVLLGRWSHFVSFLDLRFGKKSLQYLCKISNRKQGLASDLKTALILSDSKVDGCVTEGQTPDPQRWALSPYNRRKLTSSCMHAHLLWRGVECNRGTGFADSCLTCILTPNLEARLGQRSCRSPS